MFVWPKRIFNAVFNRLTITLALIILQAVYIGFWIYRFYDYSKYISIGFTVLQVICVLYIIWRDNNPAYQIGWIVLVCLLPVFGTTFYLLFGNKRPARSLKKKLDAQESLHQDELVREIDYGIIHEERLRRTASYVTDMHYPAWQKTSTKYYPVADLMFEDMIEDLKKAEHFIFMEYFIISKGSLWEEIFAILKEKAEKGLDVRVIYDDIGSMKELPKHFEKNLKDNGIRVLSFNKMRPFLSLVYNNRDHRKITVIDGYIGYNGGANLADEYANRIVRFGHWKDGGIRLYGDACWNYTVMFLNMWNAFQKEAAKDPEYGIYRPGVWHKEDFPSDGLVQPYSDTPLDEEDLGENVYLEIINQAQDYVFIYTPYLILDEDVQTALKLAAKRHVDVRLVTPGIPDKKIVYSISRSYYEPLMRAGVKIYEYTPGFIHAKNFVSDDRVAVIGTINIDYRSLFLHFECGTLLYETDSIADIRNDCIETFRRSRLVTEEDYRKHFIGSLFGAVLRILSPLL